jgi:hypothetical protein
MSSATTTVDTSAAAEAASIQHVPPNVIMTVNVNHKPVNMPLRGTVLDLKRAAIDQLVPIDLGFLVFMVKPHGLSPALPDDTVLTFHQGEEFRCVAPDDNS